MASSEDKLSPVVEELPYFAESFPGKVCCLCNLPETSSLGQGELLRIEANESILKDTESFKNITENITSAEIVGKSDELDQFVYRRTKTNNKHKTSNECYNEHDRIGHVEPVNTLNTILDGTHVFVHRMCIMWSEGFIQNNNGAIKNVEAIVTNSLIRRCSFCGLFGASVPCKMRCEKMFHLPCAAASGCLLLLETLTAFCVDHLSQAYITCTEMNISCNQCSYLGDISKLVMCSTCGNHYHTTCIGLANQPDTKSGWNCSNCSKCQICRQNDSSEMRAVKCEQCQKLYHATCLRPILLSVPKYGWKCNRCRVCTDCGSRTPGAGTSSRWHSHYTICDSCYQQRNKGFSCPICHRAYRAAAHKEMVKCSWCNRFVHSACDSDADLSTYHKRKETNPDYDYLCPQCKVLTSHDKFVSSNSHAYIVSSGLPHKDHESESMERSFDDKLSMDENQKCLKKRIALKELPRRGGKSFQLKSNLITQLSRKRSRGKSRQPFMYGGSSMLCGGERGSIRNNDEDISIDKKIILASAKDKFLLSQDVCVMCGALGIDHEGCLIACSQCGQCYHPYCVNIKVTKIMLEKGWRCLDCTVCEGCGQKNDESRLLLCDDCDISYHIYCMSPPLDTVPNGNWKCKWCAICQKCGVNVFGKNYQWRNGLLECGPCGSQVSCCVCYKPYVDNDLIIQCKNCERWLHCSCDSIKSEEEAKVFENIDYQCRLCRPKEKTLTSLIAHKNFNKGDISFKNAQSTFSTTNQLKAEVTSTFSTTNETSESAESLYWVDGVCVSERGLNVIKNLTTEVKKKRKIRSSNEVLMQKDLGILATIESVVAASSTGLAENAKTDSSNSNLKKEDNYKDGMVWNGNETAPPPGFSITTNEDGVNILRKKRQRNLQKVGIGGFNVRNRACKKEDEEKLHTADIGTISATKKKKNIRKKIKSKLTETYPAYLQEAFFGKDLLDTTNTPSLELDEVAENDDYKCLVPSFEKNSQLTEHSAQSEDNSNQMASHMETKKVPVVCKKTSFSSENLLESLEKHNECEKSSLMESHCSNYVCEPSTISRFEEKFEKTIENTCTLENRILNNFDVSLPNNIRCENTNKIRKNSGTINGNSTPLTQHQLESIPHVSLGEVQQQITTPYQIRPSCMLTERNQTSDPLIKQCQTLERQSHTLFTMQNEGQQLQLVEPMEAIVVGTQKTAEKMRRDEELGPLATISAVLYSNTQHPDLKQTHPNWNDRCKQILKRWRSLSTEKKAPFLQLAKDNRSALRMRRAQHDQEKTNVQQKTLKEQEQERMWKIHQSKAKEVPSVINKNGSNTFDGSAKIAPLDVVVSDIKNESRLISNSISNAPTIILQPTDNTNIQVLVNKNELLKKKQHVYQSQFVQSKGNKQLRRLLQNQTVTSLVWNPEAVDQKTFSMRSEIAESKKYVDVSALPKTSLEEDLVSANSRHDDSSTFLPSVLNKSNIKTDIEGKAAESTKPTAADFEKLDTENAGFGDILGGLGEGDDDDLLKSLTAEIGDDFNILQYADPELDELTSGQNILNKLDFDEGANNNFQSK